MDHKDRSWILRAIGLLLVGAGAFTAGLAPLELFIFHWFTPGGRFHYAGFGFGSFMFANMASDCGGVHPRGRRPPDPQALGAPGGPGPLWVLVDPWPDPDPDPLCHWGWI